MISSRTRRICLSSIPSKETYFGYYGRVLLTFLLFTPFLLLNNVFLRKQSHTRRVLDKTFQPILHRGVETSDIDSAGILQK
jgi:hypothetical protein